MSHTHTHTIDVIVDVRMTSRDVIVGIRMTSLPVYGHTECDTRLSNSTTKTLDRRILIMKVVNYKYNHQNGFM